MNDNDVLVELRTWRDEFARRHGYDLQAMAATLRDLDRAAGQQLVYGEPRRPEVTTRSHAELPPPLSQPEMSHSSASPIKPPL